MKIFPLTLKTPDKSGASYNIQQRSSTIQTILSALESHQINRFRESRAIPSVGNLTLPRRFNFILLAIITYYRGICKRVFRNYAQKFYVSNDWFTYVVLQVG